MESIRIHTQAQLEEAFYIRRTVFVEEQGVPLEDEFDSFDTLDSECVHILVIKENQPVGTGRIRFVDEMGKLERICILEPFRKFGLGKLIIKSLEDISLEQHVEQVKLHGQTQAEGFYQKLGYHAASEVFDEDGIPHVKMMKTLAHLQ